MQLESDLQLSFPIPYRQYLKEVGNGGGPLRLVPAPTLATTRKSREDHDLFSRPHLPFPWIKEVVLVSASLRV